MRQRMAACSVFDSINCDGSITCAGQSHSADHGVAQPEGVRIAAHRSRLDLMNICADQPGEARADEDARRSPVGASCVFRPIGFHCE